MAALTVIKCVFMGDLDSKKTDVVFSFIAERCPRTHTPATVDNYRVDFTLDHIPVSLNIWNVWLKDTSEKLYPITFPNTDIFFFCFSLSNRNSLLDLETKWLPTLLRHLHSPNPPIVLLGVKDSQLIKCPKDQIVTPEEIRGLKERIGAKHYQECVVDNLQNVRASVENCVRIVLKERHK